MTTSTSELGLIDALEALRQERRWTDEELARELGINRTTWSLVRSGKRLPSRSTLAAVIQRFPDFTPLVTLFLSSNVTHSDTNDTESDTTRPIEAAAD